MPWILLLQCLATHSYLMYEHFINEPEEERLPQWWLFHPGLSSAQPYSTDPCCVWGDICTLTAITSRQPFFWSRYTLQAPASPAGAPPTFSLPDTEPAKRHCYAWECVSVWWHWLLVPSLSPAVVFLFQERWKRSRCFFLLQPLRLCQPCLLWVLTAFYLLTFCPVQCLSSLQTFLFSNSQPFDS